MDSYSTESDFVSTVTRWCLLQSQFTSDMNMSEVLKHGNALCLMSKVMKAVSYRCLLYFTRIFFMFLKSCCFFFVIVFILFVIFCVFCFFPSNPSSVFFLQTTFFHLSTCSIALLVASVRSCVLQDSSRSWRWKLEHLLDSLCSFITFAHGIFSVATSCHVWTGPPSWIVNDSKLNFSECTVAFDDNWLMCI